MNKNKKYILSGIITFIIIGSLGTYYSVANNDYTCYKYVKTSTCSISTQTYLEAKATPGVSCTTWNNGKSVCSGLKGIDTYTRGSAYRCANNNAKSVASYTVPNQACQVEYTDIIAPSVTSGGVE